MNERIRELAEQTGFTQQDLAHGGDQMLAEFAELIVRECDALNTKQSYELSGVIIDTEEGGGFDEVCLRTVKRVHRYLNGKSLSEHFGVK